MQQQERNFSSSAWTVGEIPFGQTPLKASAASGDAGPQSFIRERKDFCMRYAAENENC